jgi:hypothetical protein
MSVFMPTSMDRVPEKIKPFQRERVSGTHNHYLKAFWGSEVHSP